jgi:hypothetical protein
MIGMCGNAKIGEVHAWKQAVWQKMLGKNIA